jgi:hypothetical protein
VSRRKLAVLLIPLALVVGAASIFIAARSSTSLVVAAPTSAITPSQSIRDTRIPPQGAPLAQSLPALKVLARGGNRLAKVRWYRDLSTCLGVSSRDSALQALSKSKTWIVNNSAAYTREGVVDVAGRDKALAVIEDSVRQIEQGEAMCSSAPKIDDGQIYEAALAAADEGDTNAASCLLSAPFNGPTADNFDGQAFGSAARAAGEAALKYGDWNVVSALRYVYGGEPLPGVGTLINKKDTFQNYRYTKLLRYGYPDGSPLASTLDAAAGELASELTPDQVARSDSWAAQIYHDSFFGSGWANPDRPVCVY